MILYSDTVCLYSKCSCVAAVSQIARHRIRHDDKESSQLSVPSEQAPVRALTLPEFCPLHCISVI
jgi:hypothetical protein